MVASSDNKDMNPHDERTWILCLKPRHSTPYIKGHNERTKISCDMLMMVVSRKTDENRREPLFKPRHSQRHRGTDHLDGLSPNSFSLSYRWLYSMCHKGTAAWKTVTTCPKPGPLSRSPSLSRKYLDPDLRFRSHGVYYLRFRTSFGLDVSQLWLLLHKLHRKSHPRVCPRRSSSSCSVCPLLVLHLPVQIQP